MENTKMSKDGFWTIRKDGLWTIGENIKTGEKCFSVPESAVGPPLAIPLRWLGTGGVKQNLLMAQGQEQIEFQTARKSDFLRTKDM